MYQSYFNFPEAPFTISPNPRFLYLSDRHREALAHLQYGLQENGGFILLTGEVGTGKTTVWRCLAGQIPDSVHLAVVLNPRLTESDLIESVCDEFGVAYEANCGIKRMVDALNRHLLQLHERGERAVLIVEEAQNLEPELLEQLRLLTNLETDESKLLQIILIGQPELLDKIDSPALRQLRQRITARFHLTSLNADEVRAYIAHRLSIVGGGLELFSDRALLRLAKHSGGIPRLINLICDRALLGCFSENKHRVDTRILDRAAREVLGGAPEKGARKRARKAARRALAGVSGGSPAGASMGASARAFAGALAGAPARAGVAAAGLALIAASVWFYGGPRSAPPGDAAPLHAQGAATKPAVKGAAPGNETLLAAAPPAEPLPVTQSAPPSAVAHTMLLQQSAGAPRTTPRTTPPPSAAPPPADWRDGVAVLTPGNAANSEPGAAPGNGLGDATNNQSNTAPGNELNNGSGNATNAAQSNAPNTGPNAAPDNAPYRTLFGFWDIELPRELAESPCQYALRHGLDCWHRRGGLGSIERANRPALLKMVARRDGHPFYAVLEGFTASGLVRLHVAGAGVDVARHELDEVWTGEYTLLWRRPAGYLNTLYPGDKNDTVRWVAQRLATLTGDRSLLRHSTVYTPALENRIRNFQRHCGLFVDGLVGKETLIRINSLTGKAPLLRDDVLSCRSRLG